MPNERTVNDYPLPFDSTATPYNNNDFDQQVKELCDKESVSGQLQNHLRVAKCVVVGDIAVGKTCLINRFGYGVFSSNYKGQERFKCISTTYYRGARVAVIVFDLSNLSTLLNAHRWLQEVLDANPYSEKPLLFLVGAKKDLLCNDAYEFVHEEAVKVANQLEAELWPVSARSGENVSELFTRIAGISFNTMLINEINESKNNSVKEYASFADRKRDKSFIRLSKKKKGDRDKSYCVELSCVIK